MSLLAFRQVLTEILPAWIQLHCYGLTRTSRIISQNHMSGISLLSQNAKKLLHNLCGHFPWTFMGNPVDGAKFYPTPKNVLIFPIKKTLFNRSFAIKSFICSPSNSSVHVITLCNLYLKLQSFLLYHILYFRIYVQTCYANLTNQCLLNVAFSMTKVLNNRSSPKENFDFFHLSIPSLSPELFWKPCFH